MDKKRMILCLLCGMGGSLVGFCAGRLDTVFGMIGFVVGVALLTGSIANLNKK